jgi:hypothetical protein
MFYKQFNRQLHLDYRQDLPQQYRYPKDTGREIMAPMVPLRITSTILSLSILCCVK